MVPHRGAAVVSRGNYGTDSAIGQAAVLCLEQTCHAGSRPSFTS